MTPEQRSGVGDAIDVNGRSLNELRMLALRHNLTFLAGIIRAAEELMVFAKSRVDDVTVPDAEL
jgi:hypothetical protein